MSCELSDLTARDRNTAEGLKMIRVKGEGKVFFLFMLASCSFS